MDSNYRGDVKAAANHKVTVLLPSRDVNRLIREAVRAFDAGGAVLDLAAGRVGGDAPVRDHVGAVSNGKRIDGRDYESELAESAQADHVRWLAEMADVPLWCGASLRKLFAYASRSVHRLSLWWLLGLSRRGLILSPYSWILFSLAIIGRVRRERALGRWLTVGNRRT